MSRERARISGPGYQPSKHQLKYGDRQRIRRMREEAEQPLPQRSLAERVLPWRRKKRRQHEAGRAEAAARWREYEGDTTLYHRRRRRSEREGKVVLREKRSMHRRAWSGKITLAGLESLVKSREGRLKHVEHLPIYDHPQQRRIERLLRQSREDDAQALAREVGLKLNVPAHTIDHA